MTQGNKLVKSFIGATYSDNQSYLKNNSYYRLGLRTNFDFTITPKFKANVSLAYNRGINKRTAAWAGGLGDAMSTALRYIPSTTTTKPGLPVAPIPYAASMKRSGEIPTIASLADSTSITK